MDTYFPAGGAGLPVGPGRGGGGDHGGFLASLDEDDGFSEPLVQAA